MPLTKNIALVAAIFIFIPIYSQNASKILEEMFNHELTEIRDSSIIRVKICASKLPRKFNPEKRYLSFNAGKFQSVQGGSYGQLISGQYTEFYRQSKALKSQGNIIQGLTDGTWNYWTKDGFLSQSVTFKKGTAKGRYHYFYPSGKIRETGRNTKHGKAGIAVQYSENGYKCFIRYKKGTPIWSKSKYLSFDKYLLVDKKP